jgi:predicted Fe-Mo cluster-binding NifX family protein
MWFESMQFHVGSTSEWLIRALNSDIVRENRMAAECMDWALKMAHFTGTLLRKQLLACAAAAMCNATVLASEVISLGGAPPQLAGGREFDKPPGGADAAVATGRLLLRHYRNRIQMAEKLGMVRLREVFQEIARSKSRYLAHARVLALVPAEGPVAPTRSLRIAVPTDDGVSVAERLGRSVAFLVFQTDDGKIRRRELRPRRGAIGPVLAGCEVVLCASIGPRAAAVLKNGGITPVLVAAGAGAAQAVADYLSGLAQEG